MPRQSKRNERKPRYGGGKSAKRRTKRPASRQQTPENENAIRLQKVLASSGIGSRRECEEIIREGRVTVDGKTVTEMGTRVDLDAQQVRVDGEPLRRPKKHYYVVNKPTGILSTNKDPSGRPRVIDLTPNTERLFTVGRLDKTSEGLILVTNDGKLTDMLTHPRYGVEKTYLAQVAGIPTPESLAKLRRGVKLAEGFAHAKRVYVRRSHGKSSILEMVLDEGRNREVRRLLARVGHKVMKLRRTAMGPLRIGELRPGESRTLRREEVEELYRAAEEGKRNKSREQHERRKAAATAEGPGKPAIGAVRPIIDKSLPAGSFAEQSPADFFADTPDDEIGTLVSPETLSKRSAAQVDDADLVDFEVADTEFALASEDFEADDAEETSHGFRPIGEDDAEEFAEIDLSPIQRGKESGPRSPIVIGSDRKQKTPSRGFGGKKSAKNKQRGRGKPRGGAGGPRARMMQNSDAAATHASNDCAENPLHAQFYADRAAVVHATVLENVQVARDTFRVRFECPEIARSITPGQFIMLRLAQCNDPLLGRPLALYDTVLDSAAEPVGIDVVYLAGGKFTRRLSTYQPGQKLELWGPLGNGFPLQTAEHLIIVAGGIGQTPFLALAAEHLGLKTYGSPPRQAAKPKRITMCYGARSAEYFASIDDFRRVGLAPLLSTDDGSLGHRGFVTELLEQQLNSADSLSKQIVCCGPEPMMAAVAQVALQHKIACQVSLETPMACGIGICFTCVAKVLQPDGSWDYKRTCVEGPIFDAETLVW